MGPDDCKKFYQELLSQCGDVLSSSFEGDKEGAHTKAHNAIQDLHVWIEVTKEYPENQILTSAVREYQFALLSLVLGHYRQAFISLRLFLEFCLATVSFSAHELDYRLWLRGEKDINWNALVDPDKGALSKSFVRAFFEQLADEAKHYRMLAEKVYRECSEYVHGNAHTHEKIPENLEYNEALFIAWHDKANSIRALVNFTLASRYLLYLDKTSIQKLESILQDDLGHLEAVRFHLGAATEVET